MRLLSHGRLEGPQLRWGKEKLNATTLHFSALVLFIDVSYSGFANTQVLYLSMNVALTQQLLIILITLCKTNFSETAFFFNFSLKCIVLADLTAVTQVCVSMVEELTDN
jgi:hypothetical protein